MSLLKRAAVTAAAAVMITAASATNAGAVYEKPTILSLEVNGVYFEFIDREDYDREAITDEFDGIMLCEGFDCFLPLRYIAEKSGYTVDWDESNRRVTAVRDNVTVTFTIGESSASVNGSIIDDKHDIRIVNDRTYASSMLIMHSLNNFPSQTADDSE